MQAALRDAQRAEQAEDWGGVVVPADAPAHHGYRHPPIHPALPETAHLKTTTPALD
jgi:hypothetical protein